METAPSLVSWPIVVAAMFLAVLVLAAANGLMRRRRNQGARHSLDSRRERHHRPLNR